MKAALAALVLFFTFDASPSSDVAFYQCIVHVRETVEVACPAGYAPPCFGMSALPPALGAGAVVCDVYPASVAVRLGLVRSDLVADFDFVAVSIIPPAATAIFGCVRAVDFSGNVSACVTEGDDEPIR